MILSRKSNWVTVLSTLMVAASILFPVCQPVSARQARNLSSITVTAHDPSGNPILGAKVDLRNAGAVVATAETNERGEARFADLVVGTYEVTIAAEGFEPLSQTNVTLTAGTPVEIKFSLSLKVGLNETVTVKGGEIEPPSGGGNAPTQLDRTLAKDIPSKPSTVTDTLPLVPGVLRTPDGEIKISGSGEHRSAMVVNGADVTDPATGQFGMTVPVDSVDTITVFKSPYLAQFGRFTAGVVSVETRRGADKWSYELNDPLPDFRILGGHLLGIRDASPRFTVNGPLIKDKLFFSEGIEYDIRKTVVHTLAFPFDESKHESANSFTQLDYILSPTNTLSGTFHVAPGHTNFANLDFFNPQPTTPSFSSHDYTGTIIDRATLGGNLLESLLAVKRFNAAVWGQGDQDMTLTPTGTTGNYFSRQDRAASRQEWMEIYSLSPIQLHGSHNLKFGSDATRTSNAGQFDAHPVNIVDALGRLEKRIEFLGDDTFNRKDFEIDFFGQDHWVVAPSLTLDMGMRFERQGITETIRVAPRAGFAWTPFANHETVFRGGIGVFYDRVPLSVYSFSHYPEQVITTFDPEGNITDGPRTFVNITGQAANVPFPFVHQGKVSGNFAPYSVTWSAEVEHPLTSFLRVRANYQQSNSSNVITVNPRVVDGQDALVLDADGKSRHRQLELSARVRFKERNQFFVSYVRSETLGDINEFTTYLGNFPFPLVRPNQFSSLPGDIPNRFLAWGRMDLPWKMSIAPIIEYRTGFVYSVTDALQNYVGPANSKRYPGFLSVDARVSKDIKLNPKYSVRLSVSGFNLTDHFNPLAIHANIADPNFGVFFGSLERKFKLDFDVLF